MKIRQLTLLAVAASLLSLSAGCELIVDFDRNKITADGGRMDTGMPDTGMPDSGQDAGDAGDDAGDAGDSGMMDATMMMPDTGVDATVNPMDAAMDATDNEDSGL
jgi:hypothetical protein